MKLKYLLSILSLAAVYFMTITIPQGCASMIPPTGGPRDTLPPVMVSASPHDSVLNYKGKKIVLGFNEYIQLEKVQQNLIVSPVPKINPIIDARLKTLTINIKDTLEPSTTYTYNFGNALKDNNEGNTLQNFTYVYSTGPYLDSLELGGKVLVAETGRIDTTLIVMLYKNLTDSAVVKDRPRYITRVDSSGTFRFTNLAPGRFAIYALKDEGARRYLSKNQLFAFADSTVTSASQKKDIMLYAFQEKDTAYKTGTSSAKPVSKKPKDTDKVLRVHPNVGNEGLDLLSNLELTFEPDPLKTFDSTKVQFTNENFEALKGYSWRRDTSGKKLSLVYPWTEATKYNLILDPAFAVDTMGRKLLKTDTISFDTKREGEYGLVKLRFINLKLDRHPVLQFIQNDEVKFSYIFTSNQFYARLFTPGEYELRLIYDENRNGKWDTGSFFGKRQQPEKVQLIKRKIVVKANWDNDVDIPL